MQFEIICFLILCKKIQGLAPIQFVSQIEFEFSHRKFKGYNY